MNSSSRRVLGSGAAGVVGVAAALASASLATASLAHAAPGPSSTPQAAHGPNSAGADRAAQPQATSTSSAPVTPNYGYQKYRVGVQVKDGSYVPPGTSTGNTELTVTESGPGVLQQTGKNSVTTTCSTDPTTVITGSTATYCQGGGVQPARMRALAKRYAPQLTVRPTPGGAPRQELVLVLPGDTVTITQTTVQPNLVKDTSTAVLGPCEVNPNVPAPVCGTGDNLSSFTPLETDLIFDDPGLPPVAADDTGTSAHGAPVDIHVTGNDNTFGAPITGLSVVTGPAHGTATPLAGDGGPAGPTPSAPASSSSASASQSDSSSSSVAPGYRAGAAPAVTVVGTTIRYTPAAGFSGTDTFTYRLTDANGSATAKVTVTVSAAPSSSASSTPSSSATTSNSASLSPSSTSRVLANTGTNSSGIGEIALVLLASGGVLTVLGRRRATGRHARSE